MLFLTKCLTIDLENGSTKIIDLRISEYFVYRYNRQKFYFSASWNVGSVGSTGFLNKYFLVILAIIADRMSIIKVYYLLTLPLARKK